MKKQLKNPNIKLSILILLSMISFISRAQQNETIAINVDEFHITKPVSSIMKTGEDAYSDYKKPKKESGDRKHREPQQFPLAKEGDPVYGNDTSMIQEEEGTKPSSQVKVSFAGQSTTGLRPYDPTGAVGLNHYIQMINATTFRIFTKTGSIIGTALLGDLWSPATPNSGDPIVMYDKAADRWFLAQFGTVAPYKIYIAISSTSDPTGSYYAYTFNSPILPDYLKFGIWHDAYYMTCNTQSTNQLAFAFKRDLMLAGSAPLAVAQYFTSGAAPASGFFCPIPADASDGVLPPAGTPCPLMFYSDNGWGAGYSDAVNIVNMSVNWAATPSPAITLTSGGSIPTSAFDASYDPGWNDCVQPGTSQKLDGIGGVLMYRAQWKSWNGFNTVILNWAVKVSSNERGIMWCEMRRNPTTNIWSIYQQGIYSPGTDTRWMGSILMNDDGCIGLTYLRSNATAIYPSLYYTGRKPCDPLGTLPLTETLVSAGTVAQTGVNRVGDYAHATIDPSNGTTFWATGEYFGGTSSTDPARTRVFSYNITPCVPLINIAITAGTATNCAAASVTFTATTFNDPGTPSFQWKVNGVNAGTNSPTFTSTFTSTKTVTCVMTPSFSPSNPVTSSAIVVTVDIPNVVANSPASQVICSGTSVNLSATGAATYVWNPGGLSGASVTVTPTAFMTTYTVTGTSAAGCTSTDTKYVQVQGIINISPSSAIEICSGASTTLTATTSSGSSTYVWNPGAISGSSITVTPTATTTYTVTCTTSSGLVCTTTATKQVIVKPLPTITTINADQNPVCPGSASLLWCAPTSNRTFTWNPGNVVGNFLNFFPTATTIYTVTVTSTITGCTKTYTTVPVVVNPTPTVSATSSANTTCAGTPVTLSATTTNGLVYTWSPGSLSGSSVVVTPTATTIYTVSATATGFSCAGKATKLITVNPLPTINTSVTSTSICSGAFTTLSATGALNYTWNPGGLNGSSITVSPTSTTTYTVAGANASGCTKTSTMLITVTAPCQNILNLKCYIEGYYTGAGNMQPALLNQGIVGATSSITDSVNVQLRNITSPFAVAAEQKVLLNTNGTTTCNFLLNGSYYIVVNHRNALQTWSANPLPFPTTTSYDFSTAASNAYGSNQTEVGPGIWALYSGELNADENIDLLDLGDIETDINNFQFGYFATDINGDGNVDLLDAPTVEANINGFIFSSHP